MSPSGATTSEVRVTVEPRSDHRAPAPAEAVDIREVLRLLDRVLAQQGADRARLAHIDKQQDRILSLLETRRSRHSPERDAALLSAIAATFGASVFATADLLGASDAELRAALGADVDGHALGVWLRRLRRSPITPYRLRWIKRAGPGTLWALDVDAM